MEAARAALALALANAAAANAALTAAQAAHAAAVEKNAAAVEKNERLKAYFAYFPPAPSAVELERMAAASAVQACASELFRCRQELAMVDALAVTEAESAAAHAAEEAGLSVFARSSWTSEGAALWRRLHEMRRAARSLRDKEKAILASLAAAERRHVVMLLRVERAYAREQADKENMKENHEVPPADACVVDIAT